MRYLIASKLPDGRYQTRAWINADGSETVTIYKDAQAAALVLPVLDKINTGTAVDSDVVNINFKDDGSIDTFHAEVISKNKDDAGSHTLLKGVSQTISDKVTALNNSVAPAVAAASVDVIQ